MPVHQRGDRLLLRAETGDPVKHLGEFENLASTELARALDERGFEVRTAADAKADYLLQYRITDFGRSPRKWIGSRT